MPREEDPSFQRPSVVKMAFFGLTALILIFLIGLPTEIPEDKRQIYEETCQDFLTNVVYDIVDDWDFKLLNRYARSHVVTNLGGQVKARDQFAAYRQETGDFVFISHQECGLGYNWLRDIQATCTFLAEFEKKKVRIQTELVLQFGAWKIHHFELSAPAP